MPVKEKNILLAYAPRAAFMPFHNRTARWASLVVHRRGGKTVAVANDIIKRALEKAAPYAYIAPFRAQAKSVAWEYFKYYAKPLLKGDPNEADLKIRLVNGSTVQLFGADNADAMRGLGFGGAGLDEYGDFKPSVWGSVIRPTLSERRGWAVFMGTPKGHNQFYDLHKVALANGFGTEEAGNYFAMVLRASESGILHPDELRSARAQSTEDQYNQEYECFPAGTLVSTSRGYFPIERIRANDSVLTHRGRWRPVQTALSKQYRGELVSIKAFGSGEALRVTPEHPFRVYRKKNQRYEWVKAEDLKPDDYLFLPVPKSDSPLLTEDLASILAWYIAEGSVNGNAVQFSLNPSNRSEIEDVRMFLNSMGFVANEYSHGNLTVNSVSLADRLTSWCGSLAENKRIPFDLILGNEELFFEQLMKGDGCLSQPTQGGHAWMYTTISRSLAYDVQLLAGMIGRRAGITIRPAGEMISPKNGKTYPSAESYCVRIPYGRKVNHSKVRDAYPTKHGIAYRIREIHRESFEGTVYNLSVKEDESYVANGRAVHNCSFDAAILGAFYGREMSLVDREGRIGAVPHDPEFPVFTAWDLGHTDDTAIWFYQNIGNEIHILDCHAESGGTIEEFSGDDMIPGSITQQVIRRAKERGYRYEKHWLPHDAKAKTLGSNGKSTVEKLARYLGMQTLQVVPMLSVQDGIQAARSVLGRCYFDTRCGTDPDTGAPSSISGIEALRQYQREYDEDKKAFRTTPLHNWCFTEETEVLTRIGTYRVMDLPLIGEVLTSCGWKRYRHPRITRINARVVAVKFKNGYTVNCTPDHLFKTENGWKSAESLMKGTLIQSGWTQSLSTLMVDCIGSGLKRFITLAAASRFTGRFGRALLDKYRTVAISITKILTRPIISSPISNAYHLASISPQQESEMLPTKTPKEFSTFQKMQEPQQPHGILLMPGSCGIVAMQNVLKVGQSGLGSLGSAWPVMASSIASFAKAAIRKSIAAIIARPLIIESVEPKICSQDVWCITVPDAEEFCLGNGALVHNCSHYADAFRMLAVAEKRKIVDRIEKKEEPKFKSVNTMTLDELWEANEEAAMIEARI